MIITTKKRVKKIEREVQKIADEISAYAHDRFKSKKNEYEVTFKDGGVLIVHAHYFASFSDTGFFDFGNHRIAKKSTTIPYRGGNFDAEVDRLRGENHTHINRKEIVRIIKAL